MTRTATQRCIIVVVAVLGCAVTYLFLVGVPAQMSDGGEPRTLTSQLWPSGAFTLTSEREPVTNDVEDETYLIPGDTELDRLDNKQLNEIYWRYVNTLQTLCRNQARFGVLTDGGKEVCLDRAYTPQQSCLVYSFGSNYKFDFELGIIRAFRCEVHTFDPTMQPRKPGKTIPGTVHFHDLGLDDKDHVNQKKWEMKTLESIIHDLGHSNRTIDILKMDIEGGEWRSFNQMFKVGTLQSVKQMQVEFHFNGNPTDKLKVLRGLYEAGFRIFMRERNLVAKRGLESEYNTQFTPLMELAFVNVKFSN